MKSGIDQLIHYYPALYHVADQRALGTILEYGLLSTSAILDLFEVPEDKRILIESRRRIKLVTLQHPSYGLIVLRDQKPIQESKLQKCLRGMKVPDWYRLLNGRVFFWPTAKRLHNCLRAYNNQVVLKVDTAKLVSCSGDQIELSAINSGSTYYRASPRGAHTFLRPSEYPFETRKKSRETLIAEVTVKYKVPEIAQMICETWKWTDGQLIRIG